MFAILCPGPSMSKVVADSVRHLRVIAVNNAFELAPDAEALVANDMAWWNKNPKAKDFTGRKFSTNIISGVERVIASNVGTDSCSGVLGLEVAKILGATRILLLGADFHGSHYFGEYANGLKNTTDARRKVHAKQFANWGRAHPKIEIFNCTQGSELRAFPMARLESFINGDSPRLACATE
jgi:hypothetical protein